MNADTLWLCGQISKKSGCRHGSACMDLHPDTDHWRSGLSWIIILHKNSFTWVFRWLSMYIFVTLSRGRSALGGILFRTKLECFASHLIYCLLSKNLLYGFYSGDLKSEDSHLNHVSIVSSFIERPLACYRVTRIYFLFNIPELIHSLLGLTWTMK